MGGGYCFSMAKAAHPNVLVWVNKFRDMVPLWKAGRYLIELVFRGWINDTEAQKEAGLRHKSTSHLSV